jgi:cation diffusion facilitator CzcD-associated flavoprotein CzcO
VTPEHVDVLIVGAGLSGIGAAYHLQKGHPGKSFAILEGRDDLGGTWDLFRYPGIRSDSDMYTLGYSFKPWTDAKAIADGPSILAYIRETARENGIDAKIRFRHKVVSARWSTTDARWTVEARNGATGETATFTTPFLYLCVGYYDYDAGYTPELEGRDRFKGRIVHPQKWTSDIDYDGKRVLVIGSGATAMTLVPEMSKRAAHVTMLQRSPTYVISMPEKDPIAEWLRERVSPPTAYAIIRWKNVAFQAGIFAYCRRFPKRAKKLLVDQVRKLVHTDLDVDTHFSPRYGPWDQRMCLVPDADLFEAINAGKVSVVTDHIDTFTEKGIRLQSGKELEADLVVTATGLRLRLFGGIALEVDGRPVEQKRLLIYKGMMASDVPNMVFTMGYTNASWTLKADITAEYVCRLLRHMDSHGYAWCCPRKGDAPMAEEPLLDFSSGYVQRSLAELPKQGARAPWKLRQNYALDRWTLRHARIDDDVMQFAR